ncbi:DUF305 domain-containing protein [Arthrobacter sp. VKM Ac-2550]|uniref:DUF305 domain-containing protein n=1 Tax=Crystallibacter permensis TaxID=1938888 RepID=UPI0022272EF3|nr:DUF305 domain-containing protein [Arthrobacter sp. VKM Ac-2550]MCW2134971.1 Uncharacterized conserved protein, DUF305 family [Arthrobacter sp. VKM Ac-2550]
MQKNRISKRIPAAAASAVLALGAVAGTGAVTAPAVADAPAQSEAAASYEVDFLKNMIDHHAMAVAMSQTCLQKATHQELKELCQSILEAQQQEIGQMQTWLQDWYGITYEPKMSEGDMRSMDRFENYTGAEYEIRFMQSMIRHHWSAVREADECLESAEHVELIELCSNIRETQLTEISQMQTWLEQWYDRSGGRPAATT